MAARKRATQVLQVQTRAPDRLGPDYGRGRENLLDDLGAAYGSVLGNVMLNYLAWKDAQRRVVDAIFDNLDRLGFHAPPLMMAALRAELELQAPAKDPDAHLANLRSFLTNGYDLFWGQFAYRSHYGGNVHVAYGGETGMGKSSCAGAVADLLKPIDPERLVDHFMLYASEFPDKLANLEAGDTLVQDEDLENAGDGSATLEKAAQNTAETLRKAKIHLARIKPENKPRATDQCFLRVRMWNPEDRWGLFQLYVGEQPLAIVSLPWMKPEHYAKYEPWKDANVERTKQSTFQDPAFMGRLVASYCEHPGFVDYLVLGSEKPKLKDFQAAITLYPTRMVSTTTKKEAADYMEKLFFGWDRLKANFERDFRMAATPGMAKIAERCFTR